MWQSAVQPAVTCQVDVAWPGLWQSQHFCVPRAVKPAWQLVQAALVGVVLAWQPAAHELLAVALECVQPL